MRCAVCDIFEGHKMPFAYTGNTSYHNKVRYRELYKEFQCDDCFNSIYNSSPRFDPKFEESYKELNAVTIEIVDDAFDNIEISQESPTVPDLSEQ